MKKLKRIVKFTVETERTLIFKNRDYRRVGWCERCGTEVEMATVDEAVQAAGLSELTICRRAETGSFHFIENAAGRLFICLNTLLR